MNLKRIWPIDDFKDVNYPGERTHVLVEWKRMISMEEQRVVNCYVPADVRKKGDVIILCYEYYPSGSYDPYWVKYAYNKYNCPPLYEFTSIGVRECLSLSAGVLLGYDDKEDCFRPFLDHVDENGKNVFEKWWDIPQLKDNWKIWTEF